MTTKELIPKLIEHYQFGIDNLPMEDWENFLHKNGLRLGLCWCAERIFKIDIYESKWVEKLVNFKGGDLAKYPSRAKNRTECIELLQIRINALESIDLKTLKDE